MGWNYLSSPKFQVLHCRSLGMDNQFHLTLCKGCNYSSMLGFNLIHVSNRGPWIKMIYHVLYRDVFPINLSLYWMTDQVTSDIILWLLSLLLHCRSLGMDNQFHLTLCKGCNYSSMLGFNLIHVSNRGPWIKMIYHVLYRDVFPINLSLYWMTDQVTSYIILWLL